MYTIRKMLLSFTVNHFVMCGVTFIMMLLLGYLMDWIGMFGFSVITAVIYAAEVYTEGWRFGNKESKKYTGVEAHPMRALKACGVLIGIGIILASLTFVTPWGAVVNTVIRVYFSMFAGLYNVNTNVSVLGVIASMLVFPVFTVVGYRVGMSNFSLSETIRQKLGIKAKKRKPRVYKLK